MEQCPINCSQFRKVPDLWVRPCGWVLLVRPTPFLLSLQIHRQVEPVFFFTPRSACRLLLDQKLFFVFLSNAAHTHHPLSNLGQLLTKKVWPAIWSAPCMLYMKPMPVSAAFQNWLFFWERRSSVGGCTTFRRSAARSSDGCLLPLPSLTCSPSHCTHFLQLAKTPKNPK